MRPRVASYGAGATVARMRGKPRSASGNVPAPGCSPHTTDTAKMLGLSPVAPFSIPVFRTGAADSLAEIRAAHPAVTAVAAFDDDVALRVLAAMRVPGLAAPGDLAVIGFDDNGYGALAIPALTTVHIDAEAHGRQAARAILGLDAAGLSPAPGRVVVRESA